MRNHRVNYNVTRTTDDKCELLYSGIDKHKAFKMAETLSRGSRDIYKISWKVDEKDIECKFDVFGDWEKIQ